MASPQGPSWGPPQQPGPGSGPGSSAYPGPGSAGAGGPYGSGSDQSGSDQFGPAADRYDATALHDATAMYGTSAQVVHEPTAYYPQPSVAGGPTAYRTRAHVTRQRVLFGLGGVALLLIGYGIGRWQDTPSPASSAVAPVPSVAPSSAVPSSPSAAPTTSAPPSPAVYQTMQAESASALTGIQTQDTEDDGGGQNVGWIANGDSMRYDDVAFGPVAATKLEVRVASDGGDGGRMEVHVDSPEQPAVGVLTVTDTGGWQDWRTDEVTLTTPVTGTHTVFFTFAKDDGDEFVNINWFLFQH